MTMMNAKEQLLAANCLAELWQGLLPDYETPEKGQFLAWTGMCSPEIAAYALNRAARKAHKLKHAGEPMDSEHLGRYITGIMKNQRDGRHVFGEAQ